MPFFSLAEPSQCCTLHFRSKVLRVRRCGTYMCIQGPTFSSPAISIPAFSVPHFPVPHFPVLHFGPSNLTSLVLHFPVVHFPVPRFPRPRMNIIFNSLVKYDVHTTRKIKFIHPIFYHILLLY